MGRPPSVPDRSRFRGASIGSSSRLGLAAIGAALLLAGCSTRSPAFPSSDENPTPETRFAASSPRHLTASEIRTTSVNDLYQVVERLRPLWLRSSSLRSRQSGTEIIVVWNGSYFGPVASLRRLTPEHVRSMRYVDGATASALYPYSGGIKPHILGGIIIDMGAVVDDDDPDPRD